MDFWIPGPLVQLIKTQEQKYVVWDVVKAMNGQMPFEGLKGAAKVLFEGVSNWVMGTNATRGLQGSLEDNVEHYLTGRLVAKPQPVVEDDPDPYDELDQEGDEGSDENMNELTRNMLIMRLGAAEAGPLIEYLSGFGQAGARVPWGVLSDWAKKLLVFLGLDQAADILLGEGLLEGLVPWGNGGSVGVPSLEAVAAFHGGVVRQWTANGVSMARFADGYQGAKRQKTGVWTTWKPKRPIVLMPTGASNLIDLERADNVVGKQLGRLRKSWERRHRKSVVKVYICLRCKANPCRC